MIKILIVPIERLEREVHHTITYRFRASFPCEPGQFVMVWIPRHDELPMALSYLGDPKGITVQAVGDASTAFAGFQEGQKVGIRGPFGNAFRPRGKRALFVAGGSGMASLIAGVEAFAKQGVEVATVVGAKTADELIFVDRATAFGEVHIATDDGSRGYHGFATGLGETLMDQERWDQVVTCGPEKMMKKVVDAARGRRIPVDASLERYMKCGIGICDACAIDGQLVCFDGPIFTGELLSEIPDFGVWRRDKSGRRIPA